MNFLSSILKKPSILFNDSPCLRVQPSLVVSFPMVVVSVVEFSLFFCKSFPFSRYGTQPRGGVGKETRVLFCAWDIVYVRARDNNVQ